MRQPEQFYKKELEKYQAKTAALKQEINLSSGYRILTFFLLFFFGYISLVQTPVFWIVTLGCLALFLFLVSRHQDLKHARRFHELLVQINKTELEVAQGRIENLPSGDEFKDPDHEFSNDIDLFGPHSFFQYLNRSGLREGKNNLAEILLSNCISDIPGKQRRTKELSDKPEWRQHFTARARMVSPKIPVEEVIRWMESYQPALKGPFKKLPFFFSLVTLILLSMTIFNLNWITFLGYWGLLGLLITGTKLAVLNRLATRSNGASKVMGQYAPLIKAVEEVEFESEELRSNQHELKISEKSISKLILSFSENLNAFEQRNNLLVALLGNGFFLWDIYQASKIENWVVNYGKELRNWFSIVAQFDAWNSLGNFAFNHPGFKYPEVFANSEPKIIKVEHLAHPLMPEQIRVGNDFEIEQGHFQIITGANMAGKSTFLRSVALLILMGNTGLPVCANEAKFAPIKLISSMRTSDSLSENESYFYAELKRLQQLVAALEHEPYFVLLDEILKGTNSKDKAEGSRKFLKRLLYMHATGLIATHDLSLCEVALTEARVDNFYFDTEIREGELFFDYELKPGICTNMNASYLLRKMGLSDDVIEN